MSEKKAPQETGAREAGMAEAPGFLRSQILRDLGNTLFELPVRFPAPAWATPLFEFRRPMVHEWSGRNRRHQQQFHARWQCGLALIFELRLNTTYTTPLVRSEQIVQSNIWTVRSLGKPILALWNLTNGLIELKAWGYLGDTLARIMFSKQRQISLYQQLFAFAENFRMDNPLTK